MFADDLHAPGLTLQIHCGTRSHLSVLWGGDSRSAGPWSCASSPPRLKPSVQAGASPLHQITSCYVLGVRRSSCRSASYFVWRTTVLPCLLYGLGASGLSFAQLHTLQSLALKQLRALSGSPAHLYQESDVSLCLRLGVPLPVDALGSPYCAAPFVDRSQVTPLSLVRDTLGCSFLQSC